MKTWKPTDSTETPDTNTHGFCLGGPYDGQWCELPTNSNRVNAVENKPDGRGGKTQTIYTYEATPLQFNTGRLTLLVCLRQGALLDLMVRVLTNMHNTHQAMQAIATRETPAPI